MRVTLAVGIENPLPTLQLSTVVEIIDNESKCNRCQYFSCHRAPIVTNRRYSEGLLNDERLPLSPTPNHRLHGYSQYSISPSLSLFFLLILLRSYLFHCILNIPCSSSVHFLYDDLVSKYHAHTQKII